MRQFVFMYGDLIGRSLDTRDKGTKRINCNESQEFWEGSLVNELQNIVQLLMKRDNFKKEKNYGGKIRVKERKLPLPLLTKILSLVPTESHFAEVNKNVFINFYCDCIMKMLRRKRLAAPTISKTLQFSVNSFFEKFSRWRSVTRQSCPMEAYRNGVSSLTLLCYS